MNSGGYGGGGLKSKQEIDEKLTQKKHGIGKVDSILQFCFIQVGMGYGRLWFLNDCYLLYFLNLRKQSTTQERIIIVKEGEEGHAVNKRKMIKLNNKL